MYFIIESIYVGFLRPHSIRFQTNPFLMLIVGCVFSSAFLVCIPGIM